MIQIKSTPFRDLSAIVTHHFDNLAPVILGNLNGCTQRQIAFIRQNIHAILMALPGDLLKVNSEFKEFCLAPGAGRMKNPYRGLSRVFKYKVFSDKSATGYCAYELSANLGFNTCPYCNRGYNVTVTKDKRRIVRPDFDHFFAQSKYPLLALSFYNLIPCCLVCNRTLKHRSDMTYGKTIHPYEEGFDSAFKFRFLAKDPESAVGLKSNYSVVPSYDPLQPEKATRCEGNARLFKLTEIYEQSHAGEVSDILRRHHVSNGDYLKGLSRSFPALGSLEELYRIAFGTYYSQEDFERRPLSKLIRDVTDQLGFAIPGLPLARVK